MNYSAPNFKLKKNDDMERDIIYYHIAIQQIEQLNKHNIFIKLNDHYHIYIYKSINLNGHMMLKKQTNLKC